MLIATAQPTVAQLCYALKVTACAFAFELIVLAILIIILARDDRTGWNETTTQIEFSVMFLSLAVVITGTVMVGLWIGL